MDRNLWVPLFGGLIGGVIGYAIMALVFHSAGSVGSVESVNGFSMTTVSSDLVYVPKGLCLQSSSGAVVQTVVGSVDVSEGDVQNVTVHVGDKTAVFVID